MNQPEPQGIQFSTLMGDIDKGLIKIPQFQRDFVWSKEKSAKLIDSILKGYPIGTFILWKTKEALRTIKNLGKINLPETPQGEFIQYVLDGQQRLTTLYCCIKGLLIQRNGVADDFSELYVDLLAKEDEDIILIDISEKEKSNIIKLCDLMNKGIKYFADNYEKHYEIIDKYRTRLQSYSFSIVLIRDAPIDVATEIFTRINVTGQPLSVFEIMVAKTFDPKKKFDLAEKFDDLIERLETVDYETISSATILQTVSVLLVKECSKKHILKLDKDKFIKIWDKAIDAIEHSVEYFRNYYRIPVSKLLPYNALIIPFSYFFFKHKSKPTGLNQKYLEDFFWRTSLTSRYSSSLESRVSQDIKRIDKILIDKLPKYESSVDISPEFIESNGWFSASTAYIKALLCLLAHHEPKSFIDNSIVRLSNDWLKQANSKNYHHFFPKSYLKTNGEEYFYINHIANITLVDDFLNKNVIRAKSPAQYMKSFRDKNPDLDKAMQSHLIKIDSFGIWENDYDTFFRKRINAFSTELKKRIIIQAIDRKSSSKNSV